MKEYLPQLVVVHLPLLEVGADLFLIPAQNGAFTPFVPFTIQTNMIVDSKKDVSTLPACK